jgi:hypothetical protein
MNRRFFLAATISSFIDGGEDCVGPFPHREEKGLNRIGDALEVVLIGRSKCERIDRCAMFDILSDISEEMSRTFPYPSSWPDQQCFSE